MFKKDDIVTDDDGDIARVVAINQLDCTTLVIILHSKQWKGLINREYYSDTESLVLAPKLVRLLYGV